MPKALRPAGKPCDPSSVCRQTEKCRRYEDNPQLEESADAGQMKSSHDVANAQDPGADTIARQYPEPLCEVGRILVDSDDRCGHAERKECSQRHPDAESAFAGEQQRHDEYPGQYL